MCVSCHLFRIPCHSYFFSVGAGKTILWYVIPHR
jgi:hypothetical protein